MKIDINSDLGEGFGRWKMADDEGMMDLISSANVACGMHAGDAMIMTRMTRLAKERGVALGAHCGLPDKLGFGRIVMDIPPTDLAELCLYQLGALDAIAKAAGYAVTHAGGHGAMGEMVRKNPEYEEKMLSLFKKFNPDLAIANLANSESLRIAQKLGFRTVGKVFADRAYTDEGHLVSRKLPGAVITDLEEVKRRITQFLDSGTFDTITGGRIKLEGKSILIHSDTPGAVAITKVVRETIESGGGQVVPFTELAE